MTHELKKFILDEIDRLFPVVHIMRGGYPLCGFNLNYPCFWPQGHTWIAYTEKVAKEKVTCEQCKEELCATS